MRQGTSSRNAGFSLRPAAAVLIAWVALATLAFAADPAASARCQNSAGSAAAARGQTDAPLAAAGWKSGAFSGTALMGVVPMTAVR